MDIIQQLPDSVANQIAAGEVIQRPASVIKELVENSIDAGAKTIKVLVVDAGRTSIQVIDDGCGMSDTDARLSFDRHATSKIRCADDLFSLHTMGFRGEALASIAAVAQVTLQTRQHGEELGTKICVSGSRVVSQEPIVCQEGTNFLIENLFFNVPARRKFLRSNTTEMSHINQAFERMVLVYPEINFYLYNNGQEVMRLRSGSLHQRIIDVFGKRINQTLLPLEADTSICKIRGFVGKPESSRKKGARQFFFVNGRYMDHNYFRRAVTTAYERLVPSGDKVHFFIYFDVNPEDIDVNIHPVKTEIKFENEQAIWQILMSAVHNAVGRFSGVTELDFDTEGRPDIPVYNPDEAVNVSAPKVDYNPDFNPFDHAPRYEDKRLKGASLGVRGSKASSGGNDWQSLYDGLVGKGHQSETMQPVQGDFFGSMINEDDKDAEDLADISKEHFQYRGSYIISQVAKGILLIDQHRADVRILFEEYKHTLASRNSNVQKLLFPEVVQFSPSYAPLLDSVVTEMCRLGFEMTNLGGCSYSVSGMPAGLAGMDVATLVSELVGAAVEYGSDVADEINSMLALGLAQHAATPYGEVLDQEAMQSLVDRLLKCETYRYTPDGETIMNVITHEELMAKM